MEYSSSLIYPFRLKLLRGWVKSSKQEALRKRAQYLYAPCYTIKNSVSWYYACASWHRNMSLLTVQKEVLFCIKCKLKVYLGTWT